jgi:hypothetical protein
MKNILPPYPFIVNMGRVRLKKIVFQVTPLPLLEGRKGAKLQ